MPSGPFVFCTQKTVIFMIERWKIDVIYEKMAACGVFGSGFIVHVFLYLDTVRAEY